MDSVVGNRPLNRPHALLDTLKPATPLSPSNSTERLSGSANSDEKETAEATGSLNSSADTNSQQQGSTPRSSTTPTEQDESIATGPEQQGPSEQQQKKKGKRTKVEAAIDVMIKAFAQSSKEADDKWMQFEVKRMKFELENQGRRDKEQRDHEIHMFQTLGQMLMSTSSPMMYPPAAPTPSHAPYFMPGPPPDPNQNSNE